MKAFKFFLILALSVLSSGVANSQISERSIRESALLSAKFLSGQMWDCQRNPKMPMANLNWRLSSLSAPLDVTTKGPIDWGRRNDRYLKFDLEIDRLNLYSSLLDDQTGIKYSIAMRLYERDGHLVKTVSRWGTLIGFGRGGFMYLQEGKFGTFFPTDRVQLGSEVTYRPEIAQVTRVSEILGGVTPEPPRENVYNPDNNRGNMPRHRRADCLNMELTSGTYSETFNMRDVVRQEFGGNASPVDWNDLKAIPNIDSWIACIGLQNEQSFLVTRNGSPIYSGRRHYIAQYFASGRAPANFLIHDQIANRLFLGSWYDVKLNILAIKNEAPNNDAYRNDPPRHEAQIWESTKLTINSYSEKQNLANAVDQEFRGKAEIADWNDLRVIDNVDAWALRVRLRPNDTFFVTRDGKFTFGSNRQFFVLYSPSGRLPAGFMVHDKIANKLFLGSWYGENRPILVKDFHNR